MTSALLAGIHSIAIAFRSAPPLCSQESALPENFFSLEPPKCSKTVISLFPKPRLASSFAVFCGVLESLLSTPSFAPGCTNGCNISSGRPCKVNVSMSGRDHPTLEQISEKVDKAGLMQTSSICKCRNSLVATP